MSSLYKEKIIELVTITFIKRDNSSSISYSFSQDYFAEDEIYSGSSEVYPLLASPVSFQREVGINLGVNLSFQVNLLGASDFLYHGLSLSSFLKDYSTNNADVEVYYYTKSLDAQTTNASNNKRVTAKIINSSFDAVTGILLLSCQESFFKDKEISKKLSVDDFPDMDSKYDGTYGSIVFGQATTAADGLAIDAPFLSSSVNGASVPVATIFSGFTFPNHGNKQLRRILVKNQYKDQDKKDWLTLSLDTDPQVAGVGSSVSSPSSDPANYARDLSLVERGIVWSPSTNTCKVLTAVRTGLILPSYDRCMDIGSTQFLWNKENPSFLSRGDEDFSFSFWAKFDSTTGMILQQEWELAGSREWTLFFNSNALQFSISSDGSSIAHSAVSATLSTGTWYYITCVYDTSVNNKIYIYVNTTATNTTITNFLTKRNGRFGIGRWSANTGMDGKMYQFRYWRRALSSSDDSGLYNSGVPILYDSLTDAQKIDLVCSFPLNEALNIRKSVNSSAILGEDAQSGNSPQITYAYSNKPIVVTNQHGELTCEVYHAESLDGGNTYSPVGGLLRKATIDLSTVNLGTGSLLTTGTQNVFWQIFQNLTLADDANYFVKINFSNDKTNTYYALCYYGASTQDAATKHLTRVKRDIIDAKQGWQAQTNDFDMQFYFLGKGDADWEDNTLNDAGTTYYSYQALEAKGVVLQSGDSINEIDNTLEFKICIDGICDDGSGTYTGSAYALIENPSDIIRFILINPDFGLGIDSSLVNLTAFTSVRTSLSNIGLGKAKIIINSKTTAKDLIFEICRQYRIIFYRDGAGLLSLYFPENFTSLDYTFQDSKSIDTSKLINYKEKDYSNIINKCIQYYKPDILNIPLDESLLRLEARERLVGKLEINASSSTRNDEPREIKASSSQDVYGVRELNFNLSFHDDAISAYKVQKYYFDRYYLLPLNTSLEIKRENYLDLDLFDKVSIQDSNLPTDLINEEESLIEYENLEVTSYYEGVKVKAYSGGEVQGFVSKIQEVENKTILTIETFNNIV